MKNIQNIKFIEIDSGLKGTKEFIVTYNKDGQNLKDFVFVKEEKGLTKNDYFRLAKKEFYANVNEPTKIKSRSKISPKWLKIVAGCAGVTALAFAGLFTWKVLSQKNDVNDKEYTVKWVDEDGTLMDEETYAKGELPAYKGEYHDKTGIFKNDGEEYMHFQEGWKEDIDKPITKDTTFHAVYSDRLMVTIMTAEIDEEALTTWGGQVPIFFYFAGTVNHIDWDDGEAGEADKNNNYHIYTEVGTYTIKIYGNVRNIYTEPCDVSQPDYTQGFDYITNISFGCAYDGKLDGGRLFSYGSHLTSVTISSAVTDLDLAWPWGTEGPMDLKFDKNSRCRHIVTVTSDEIIKFKNFVIPNTVLTIEKNACAGLEIEELQFEKNSRCTYIGENAFGSSTMKSIVFPSSVTKIDTEAFYDCDQLESVFIPKTVNYIGERAFENCDALKSVVFEESANEVYIGENAFKCFHSYDEFVLPKNIGETLSVFGVGLFENATFSNITIPEGTKRLNDNLFYKATFTNDVKFPNSLEEIGDNTFNSSSIKNIDLSNTNVRTVGIAAFTNSSNLDTVKFPKTLESLEIAVFDNSSVRTVIFHEDTKIIKFEEELFDDCHNLEKIILPKSLSKLSKNTFSNCTSLESFSFKNVPNLHEISTLAFSGCTSLNSVELGDNIIAIYPDAFNNCSSLSSIKIPKNVHSIGSNAFGGDTPGLTSVDLTDFVEPRFDKIPVVEMEPFPSSVRFQVSSEAMKDVFESASGWSDYSGQFDVVS